MKSVDYPSEETVTILPFRSARVLLQLVRKSAKAEPCSPIPFWDGSFLLLAHLEGDGRNDSRRCSNTGFESVEPRGTTRLLRANPWRKGCIQSSGAARPQGRAFSESFAAIWQDDHLSSPV